MTLSVDTIEKVVIILDIDLTGSDYAAAGVILNCFNTFLDISELLRSDNFLIISKQHLIMLLKVLHILIKFILRLVYVIHISVIID